MKGFLKAIKTITYPGYRIHEGAVRAAGSEAVQAVILVLVCLFGSSSIFISMWPYKSFLYFCGTCFLALIVTGLLIALSQVVFIAVTMFVALLFIPAAYIYSGCANYLYNHKGDKAGSRLGSRPEADVGIRYFIEREDGICYKARFISK